MLRTSPRTGSGTATPPDPPLADGEGGGGERAIETGRNCELVQGRVFIGARDGVRVKGPAAMSSEDSRKVARSSKRFPAACVPSVGKKKEADRNDGFLCRAFRQSGIGGKTMKFLPMTSVNRGDGKPQMRTARQRRPRFCAWALEHLSLAIVSKGDEAGDAQNLHVSAVSTCQVRTPEFRSSREEEISHAFQPDGVWKRPDLGRIALEEPVEPAVLGHIDDCSQCRQRVEQLRAEVKSLAGHFQDGTTGDSTEDSPDRIEPRESSSDGATTSWKAEASAEAAARRPCRKTRHSA